MVSKIQDWLISSRNRLYHVYNEISFIYRKTSKQAWKLWIEEVEHEFPFATFPPEKQEYFSEVPLLLQIFRWIHPNSRLPITFQPDFPETFCKW